MLDTHPELSDHGQYPSIPLNVLLPHFFGKAHGLGQCSNFSKRTHESIVPSRAMWASIHFLDELQLGSGGFNRGHSGPVSTRRMDGCGECCREVGRGSRGRFQCLIRNQILSRYFSTNLVGRSPETTVGQRSTPCPRAR